MCRSKPQTAKSEPQSLALEYSTSQYVSLHGPTMASSVQVLKWILVGQRLVLKKPLNVATASN